MFRAVPRWLFDLFGDPPEPRGDADNEPPPALSVAYLDAMPATGRRWRYRFAVACGDPEGFHGRLRLRLGRRGDTGRIVFRFDREALTGAAELIVTSRLAPDRPRPWRATVRGFVVGSGALPAKIAPPPAGE